MAVCTPHKGGRDRRVSGPWQPANLAEAVSVRFNETLPRKTRGTAIEEDIKYPHLNSTRARTHTCAPAHTHSHALPVWILVDTVCFEMAPKSLTAHFLWSSQSLEVRGVSRHNLST